MAKIGFIGLGVMGKPMSRNLLKAGHSLVVFDLFEAAVAELAAAGVSRGQSCHDTAAQSDIIITMLPDGPDVEKAVCGPGGVLEGARKGSIVVDMSSISPLVSQKVAAACAAKGVEFLDAPVSGGEPKAVDGTLAIMVGGKPEVFEKVLPILQKMGSSVTLTAQWERGTSPSWPTRSWWPATSRPWEKPWYWPRVLDSIRRWSLTR
jgi:2-hydroxy-3-oxopropionate reductase